MKDFDTDKLKQCMYYFVSYVETYNRTRFTGFENNHFLEKEEGYKYKVYEAAHNSLQIGSWKKEHIGTGYIAERFRDAYKKKENLVFYRSDKKTELQLTKNIVATETLLYNLYLTDEDAKAFEAAVKIFGKRYDLIAFMFFIKDKDKYLPISPKHFEEAFKLFGINVKLQNSCSWENYSRYLNLIAQIKEGFQSCSGYKINLLDAHSFIWMANEAKKHYISKEMWLEILRNNTLLKPSDINLLKDFYCAPHHTSTCSEASEKTGIPVSTYSFMFESAGERIADYLKLHNDSKKEGYAGSTGILFRIHSCTDDLFEWQIKPELVEALETVYPEWRLNIEAIKNIKKDEHILYDEFLADTKEQLEISLKSTITKSDFEEFLGIPREKPKLVETKHGKMYKRDKQRSVNALHRAKYLCEYNTEHKTFLRKSENVNYTESHHLIPMAFQELFDVTLDTEANIISLCSNCHNQIHYGQGAGEIIKELYKQRNEALKKEGIVITIDELLSMYNER